MLKLKGCLRCGGDLKEDEGDWLCLQCGHYYYDGIAFGNGVSGEGRLDSPRPVGLWGMARGKWSMESPKVLKVGAGRTKTRGVTPRPGQGRRQVPRELAEAA